MDWRRRLIHISRCRGITRRMLRKILRDDPKLIKVFHYSTQELINLLSITHQKSNVIQNDLHSDRLFTIVEHEIKQYSILTIVDEDYPPMLKTIKDAPLVLYLIGNRNLLKQNPMLSVIGTRKPSVDGKNKTNLFIRPLIELDWLIVSGMARGIDSFAHQLTLACQGKTIAVLGSGFKHIYPRENIHLFNEIVRNGLVLSEYPPDTSPKPYYFPERNRIISGLSFATLVIEATEKSGTMITVDQALDQGREVYAVPGSPMQAQTKGCHRLIQEGAKLVYHPSEIIEDWLRTEKILD